MSAIDFEYAIKKDVRNNPIVREVDEARQRQLLAVARRSAASWSSVLLFSAWQHFELLQHGYKIRADAAASAPPRKRSTATCASRSRRCARPARIERIATEELHLVAPSRDRGDRDRAGDAVGAPRKVHRRGAVAPDHGGRRIRWRTNTAAADSDSPGPGRRSASRGARRPRRRSSGATRSIRAW